MSRRRVRYKVTKEMSNDPMIKTACSSTNKLNNDSLAIHKRPYHRELLIDIL